MGLDMYIHAKVYLSEYSGNPEILDAIEKIKSVNIAPNDWKPTTISFKAVYWRKANAIHKWFVENVQEGNDDCKEYYVEQSHILDLLSSVNAILDEDSKSKQLELIEELLPPTDGFFFGGTEIDEFYFDDLKHTKESLEKLLAIYEDNKYHMWFEYHSSW